MSLTTLIPYYLSTTIFLPGDVYHSHLMDFTIHVTNQSSREDALNVIQAQLAKPLVEHLVANLPLSDVQPRRKRSVGKR